MATIDAWKCPSCSGHVTTPFCAWCGEQPLSARHLTLHDLFIQAIILLSSVDSKLMRSLRWLVFRPGVLSIAYIQGRRKGFIGPVQLFLIANVIFIGMQSITQTNIFSSPFQSHLHQQDWSPIAQHLVENYLVEQNYTLSEFTPLFDQAAILHAKSLIVLMVVSFAALLPILFYRSNRPFAAHVVFALHFYAFLLLLFCISLVAAFVDRSLGGGGLESTLFDKSTSIFNLTVCAFYFHAAIGKVYRAKGITRIARALLLSLAVSALIPAYRLTVFLVTLYSI